MKELASLDGFGVHCSQIQGRCHYYDCLHGGQYRNSHGLTPESRVYQTQSRKIGCDFRVTIREDPRHYFYFTEERSVHNHPRSVLLAEFPEFRELDKDQTCLIKLLLNAHADNQVVYNCMKNAFKDRFVCTPQDISNYRARFKKGDYKW